MATTKAEVVKRKPLPDSGERTEFETGSVRDSMEGKGMPSLIPISALRSCSKRFAEGAEKYGNNTWIDEGMLPEELRDLKEP